MAGQGVSDKRMKARMAVVDEHVRSESARELDALVDTFGKSAEWRDQSDGSIHGGLSGVRNYYADIFQGFPDFTLEVTGKHVASDSIIVEVIAYGTHTGTWRGIAPTGKRVAFPACAVFTFDETDKIKAETAYFDRLTVLMQLGVAGG